MRASLLLALSSMGLATLGSATRGSRLVAQSQLTVSPKDGEPFGNVALVSSVGGGNPAIPFAWYPVRFQQIYNFDSFTNPAPVVVKSVAFRGAPLTSNGRPGGQTTRIKVRLAFTGGNLSAANPSNIFATNLDAKSLKTTVANRTIKLPILQDDTFVLKIPFDANAVFVWPGAGGKKHLVIEVFQYQNSLGNRPFSYALDAWSSASAARGSWAPNGSYAGCPSAGGPNVRHDSNAARLVVGDQNHAFLGFAQAANLPGVVVLGTTRINAPIPGTPCRLVNTMLALFGGVSQGTNGQTTIPFPIANLSQLGGLWFLTQMAWLEPGANSAGITTSRGLKQRIGLGRAGPIRTSTIGQWTNQSGNPDTFTTGRVSRGFGLITQLAN